MVHAFYYRQFLKRNQLIVSTKELIKSKTVLDELYAAPTIDEMEIVVTHCKFVRSSSNFIQSAAVFRYYNQHQIEVISENYTILSDATSKLKRTNFYKSKQ